MTDSGRSIQQRLLALARDAHAAGHHEAAYHALAASLHAAEDARDLAVIAEVVREASTQLAWLDTHLPEHRSSTRSAEARGHPAAYEMLVRQAKRWTESAGTPPGSLSPGTGV
jgi:hypothetical protein